MKEIFFYDLVEKNSDFFIGQLLKKSLEKKWFISVRLQTQERVRDLDQYLWQVEDSFLAHGTEQDLHKEFQPILLSKVLSENKDVVVDSLSQHHENNPKIIFCVEGACAPSYFNYERLVILFQSSDPTQLKQVRKQWLFFKKSHCFCRYWKLLDMRWVEQHSKV